MSVFLLAALTLCFNGVVLSYVLPGKDAARPFFRVTTLAGDGVKGYEDGPGESAKFNWPTGVVVAKDGSIYVADYSNSVIRKIAAHSGEVTTVVGDVRSGYADGVGTGALFKGPDNITIDGFGNLYVADSDNYRIRKVSRDGVVTTIAGDGEKGFRDGQALEARFGYPTDIAVAANGVLYIADRAANAIRKITPEGEVSTFAGSGHPGLLDGRGREAFLREPLSLAIDDEGVLFVADSGNNAIRKITPDGTVTTLAGGTRPGYRDGVGAQALFAWPTGIALDRDGNIYVCDSRNNKIRRITPHGIVSTVAGVLPSGSMNGPAYRAAFNFPTGIEVAPDGVILVADSGNNMIRKIARVENPGPGEKTRAGAGR